MTHWSWLQALRTYLVASLGFHLFWEVLQIQLYTVGETGTSREIVFALLHCTGGDVLIALSALSAALVVVGDPNWPSLGFGRVAVVTVAIGVAWTIWSEYFNTRVRGSWSYTEMMPVVPLLGTGLAPLAQWIVIPAWALKMAGGAEWRSLVVRGRRS